MTRNTTINLPKPLVVARSPMAADQQYNHTIIYWGSVFYNLEFAQVLVEGEPIRDYRSGGGFIFQFSKKQIYERIVQQYLWILLEQTGQYI